MAVLGELGYLGDMGYLGGLGYMDSMGSPCLDTAVIEGSRHCCDLTLNHAGPHMSYREVLQPGPTRTGKDFALHAIVIWYRHESPAGPKPQITCFVDPDYREAWHQWNTGGLGSSLSAMAWHFWEKGKQARPKQAENPQ